MKYEIHAISGLFQSSPSMRREWIEIQQHRIEVVTLMSPSMRREWIEIFLSHLH